VVEPKAPVVPPPAAPAPQGQAGADTAAVPASSPSGNPSGADPDQVPASQNPAVSAATQRQAAEQVGQPTAIEPANAALRLALAVDGPCWVSAKADGKQIVRRTMQAGERVEMTAAEVIVLTAGNPAAVTYTVNGAPGRPLGPANQVATVVINKSNAQSFAR